MNLICVYCYLQAAKKVKKDKDFETPKKSEGEETSKDKVSTNCL